MKRGILFAALGMTVAGVASASVYSAATPTVTSQPQPRLAAAPASPPVLPAKPDVKTAPAPVVQKASVETRQAPVPIQVKPRPAVNLPTVEAKATDPKPGEAGNAQEAAAGSDAFSEGAAKAAIEADGYKSVRVLRKGVNGIWHATALRGQTVVSLVVDTGGSVSAE